MKPGRIKLGATGTRSLLNGLSKVYKIGLTLGLPQRGIDDLKGLKLPPPPIITSCTPLHCRKLNPKCKNVMRCMKQQSLTRQRRNPDSLTK